MTNNTPYDPTCPMQIELALCFPYDKPYQERLLIMKDNLGLTQLQGAAFTLSVFYALQEKFGQYSTMDEFINICDLIERKFERRLGVNSAPSLALVGRSGASPSATLDSPSARIEKQESNVVPICHRVESPYPTPVEVLKVVKFRFKDEDARVLTMMLNKINLNKNVKMHMVNSIFYVIEDARSYGQILSVEQALHQELSKLGHE